MEQVVGQTDGRSDSGAAAYHRYAKCADLGLGVGKNVKLLRFRVPQVAKHADQQQQQGKQDTYRFAD